ncbi:MAG: hypothetical protein IPJ88_14520 [Myxococcales bacterium]|nr:MAG: hypothetical protein IPJ88_14520 [Myxococcales bacterium]
MTKRLPRNVIVSASVCSWLVVLFASACGEELQFDANNPARGPGQFVGLSEPLNAGPLLGGNDTLPQARDVALPANGELPDCDGDCQSYCDAAALENPINRAMCPATWGVGLSTRALEKGEACRRLYMDLIGRYPTEAETLNNCAARPWGEVVWELIDSEEFSLQCRRRWADIFGYSTQKVSVERIYDMDNIVGKLCGGYLAYDVFATVAASHPVVTRLYDTSGDRAEAAFSMFLGRPPDENERSDLARLYSLWLNDYHDHQVLGMRLPDSWLQYRCVNENGVRDPATVGECTSVEFGELVELYLRPDIRALTVDGQKRMWSGLLKADEWQQLQEPGRLISSALRYGPVFWEHIVDRVLQQYLGYALGREIPAVRSEMVDYLTNLYNGDLRAVHYAIATSAAYLQSAQGEQASGGGTPTEHRWTYGPLKQVQAEGWVKSMSSTLGVNIGACDHRITRPEDFLEAGSIAAYLLLEKSDWQLSTESEGLIVGEYRDLVRTLGGCPNNEESSRFSIVSVLTTGVQLNFASQVCDPALEGSDAAAAIGAMLPNGVTASTAASADIAEQLLRHQARVFFGRDATAVEVEEIRAAGEQAARDARTAEEFARPLCYALLSSAEMLFY